MKKKYVVPVSWVMAGEYIVEAESPEDALEKAQAIDNLPEDQSYADGFQIHEESIQEVH
jgi:hypothetical protein